MKSATASHKAGTETEAKREDIGKSKADKPMVPAWGEAEVALPVKARVVEQMLKIMVSGLLVVRAMLQATVAPYGLDSRVAALMRKGCPV